MQLLIRQVAYWRQSDLTKFLLGRLLTTAVVKGLIIIIIIHCLQSILHILWCVLKKWHKLCHKLSFPFPKALVQDLYKAFLPFLNDSSNFMTNRTMLDRTLHNLRVTYIQPWPKVLGTQKKSIIYLLLGILK